MHVTLLRELFREHWDFINIGPKLYEAQNLCAVSRQSHIKMVVRFFLPLLPAIKAIFALHIFGNKPLARNKAILFFRKFKSLLWIIKIYHFIDIFFLDGVWTIKCWQYFIPFSKHMGTNWTWIDEYLMKLIHHDYSKSA